LRALIAPFWTDWGTQTFPNVLLESLAFGVPVITSDLPVCRELFGDDLAIFVRPNDPHGLARTLQEIDHGQRALPNADHLRAHFEKHFSRKIIRARWREILSGNALLATRRPMTEKATLLFGHQGSARL
jgi:glycosyltransferase involved in cell wall biosynthesis